MSAAVRSGLLSDVEWEAAAYLGGGLPAEALSPPAMALAQAARAALDRPVMDDIVADLAAEHVPSGKTGPRVSDAGSCGRQVWYRESPPADYTPIASKYLRHAALGTIIHKAAEKARRARYPWRRYEFEIPIPGLDRPGKVDEYDPITGRATDNKTAGTWKWESVGNDGPPDDAWDQGDIYGYALDALGLPVKEIEIIVINRENGAEESFVRPYDPARAVAALNRLLDLATLLDMGVQPDRESVSDKAYPCKMCPAVDHCWNRDAAAAADRSPASYTTLGPEPDTDIIVWAGLEAIRTAQHAADATQAAKTAKELLQGLATGPYGNTIEIYDKWHTSVGYKEAFEKAAAIADLPAAYRPADGVPEPPKTKTKTTAVRLVRAAKRTKKAAG